MSPPGTSYKLLLWSGILALTSICGVSYCSGWTPPSQNKIYGGGEFTTIMTPGDHEYNHAWYAVDGRRTFVFEVQSCGSAFIALSTYLEWSTDFMLEVGLGIDDNNQTAFRYPFDVGDMASVVTPGILHCHEYRTFWIRWGSGQSVEVGQGPVVGQQMITHAHNVTPPFVNAVGLSGGYSRSATWRVQENAGNILIVDTPDLDRFESMWKSVVDRQFFPFSVSACADAHVILTEKEGRSDGNIYEFVIGGWENSRSVIRTSIIGGGRTVKASKQTADILKCDQMVTFWISWLDGRIELGFGEMFGSDKILSWKSTTPFEVRYLAISTASGNTGRWQMEDDLESINYIITPGSMPSADPNIKYNVAWIDSPEKDFFQFGVRACADVSLLISNRRSAIDAKTVELVLGAEGNTKSGLRHLGDKDWLRQVVTKDVLDCRETRSFWVGWHDNIFVVGTGFIYGKNPLMHVQLDSNFSVAALSVATVGVRGVWRLRDSVGERITMNTPGEFTHFWKTRKQSDTFVFSVKTCSDAHVMLSPVSLGYDSVDGFYDILISGGNNTRSVIQRLNSEGVVEPMSRYVHTHGLLQCDAFVDLWVRWEDGIIRVGEGSTVGVTQFLWHPLESVYPVRAVALSSGMGQHAQWRMEEDNGDTIAFVTGKISYWVSPRSPHKDVLSFRVRACSDVHLILSSSLKARTARYYEISIGFDGGTHSSLKFGNKQMAECITPRSVLDCKNDRHFWVHWDADSGLVEVGEGPLHGFNGLLSWTNPDPFDIQAISMATKTSVSGRWQLLNNAVSFVQFMTPNDATVNFDYLWRSVRHTDSFLFSVKTCANAYVALAQDFNPHYVVVLGGWHNAMSAINEYGKQVTSSVEPNLLDCNESRVFWIHWYSGYIAVGKGDVIGENKLMDYHPLVARDIRNVAFVTNAYAGLWKLDFVEATPAEPTIPPTSTPTRPTSRGLSRGDLAGIVVGVLTCAVVAGIVLVCVAEWTGRLPRLHKFLNCFRKNQDDVEEMVPSSNGHGAPAN